ncbi:MAG: hypothetical protein WDN04_28380 [Rhodospirillales bacterium]
MQRAMAQQAAAEGAAGALQCALPVQRQVERGNAVAAGGADQGGEPAGAALHADRALGTERAGVRVGVQRCAYRG